MSGKEISVVNVGVYLDRFQSDTSRVYVESPDHGRFSCSSENIDYYTLGYNSLRQFKLPHTERTLIILHPGNTSSERKRPLTEIRNLEEIARGIASASRYKVGVIISEDVIEL